MRAFKLVFVVTHILLGLLLLVLTGALWNPHSQRVKTTKRWWLSRIVRILGIEVEVYGERPVKAENQGIMFVSNHVSWIDIPLIGGIQETCFLSKAEVRDWPLIGKLAEGTGTLFIQRGSGDAKRVTGQIAERVNEGHSVLFFPEGTTTDGSSVKTFHRKLFKAGEQTAAQICPVVISYEVEGEAINPVAFIDDDEFTEHLWHLLSFPHIKARLEFLPMRRVNQENLSEEVRALEQLMRTKVEARNRRINLGESEAAPAVSL
ncbi:MAG: 1-acyl-sn-glycerol-3-phosphate acyltransferase [Pseudomonadales bacterium]|nr:1-acyl-sn-glycerol-3-phosphate acyltransferase [Pseudomonadales bacterium]